MEAHRLCINGNIARAKRASGQIFFMEIYGHALALGHIGPRLNAPDSREAILWAVQRNFGAPGHVANHC